MGNWKKKKTSRYKFRSTKGLRQTSNGFINEVGNKNRPPFSGDNIQLKFRFLIIF